MRGGTQCYGMGLCAHYLAGNLQLGQRSAVSSGEQGHQMTPAAV